MTHFDSLLLTLDRSNKKKPLVIYGGPEPSMVDEKQIDLLL